MCGITGIISKQPQTSSPITRATYSLEHRGPQNKNVFINSKGTTSLGHTRLSILDLSEQANQPMSYLGRYHIVHNGELYNYVELKKKLQQQGYLFTTQSDTEVIVGAYAAYGSKCLNYFDGMFAFAIWDEAEQLLFAARDRFGEKPFFYVYEDDRLLFASEMKALWKAGVSKEVNRRMLYNYLTIGYTSNPYNPQETFYEHIQKLPAASFLKFHLPTNQLSIENYWQISLNPPVRITENEVVETFTDLLANAVHKRMRSDVAIGTSLSGGLDSSAIVAFCAQQPERNYSQKCFTAVFDSFARDERTHAQLVAKKFNLKHHLVTIKDNNLADLMDKVMYHQEEPVISSSVLAQYKVYEAAKANGVTVLLDGQGADEILAGYRKYYRWYWQELYASKQLSASGELHNARAIGIQEPFGWKQKTAALLPQFTASLLQTSKAKKAFRQANLNREFAYQQKQHFYYSLPAVMSLNGALHFNTFTYGLDELLRYADRNSMAHAAEVRLPFLSHRLVEFLFSLPPDLKIKNGWSKWLLRKTAEPLLPASIVWRKDKTGFETPQKAWMQQPSVKDAMHEAKKLLVAQNIVATTVLQQPVKALDATAADNFDWRFWSASYLFK